MALRLLSPLVVGALILSPLAAQVPAVAHETSAVVAKKKPKKNRLKVQFVGTPTAATLPITVRGPKRKGKRWTRTLNAAKTLKAVPRGKYRITSPAPGVSIKPAQLRMKKTSRKTVTVTFPAAPAPVDTTPPAAVTNLGVEGRNIHRVLLSWNPPADAATVIVRRTYGDSPAATADAGLPVAAGNASVDDVGLIPSTRYTYTVFTRDTAGNTSAGTSVTATTLQKPLTAGGYHTCAIVAGVAKCWGLDNRGQLGDGPQKTNKNTPQNVTGLPVGLPVVAIGAGDFHTCAVLNTGSVWCWGANDRGQMGDGSLGGERPTPVQATGITDAVDVGGGTDHTCALRATGQVWCWGNNLTGQLGNGTTTSSASAVAVTGLSDAVAIAIDENRSCAVRATGAVVCWGKGIYGQLGDGLQLDRYAPTPVAGIGNASYLATGYNHTCALAPAVSCWGRNANGQLGDSTKTDRTTPAPVGGLPSRLLTAAAGAFHACVLEETGAGACWGANDNKQLGVSGSPATDRTTPSSVTSLVGATTLVSGYYHNCAVLADGVVKCWGRNLEYQMGTGNDTPSDVPVPVVGLDVYP